MRKRLILIALTGFMFGLMSCDRSDKFAGDIDMTVPAPSFTNAKAKSIYDKCGLILTTQIDSVFSIYDWTSASRYQYNNYIRADESYFEKALDLFEQGVIDIFPTEMLKKYMCRTVMLVDSCRQEYLAMNPYYQEATVVLDNRYVLYKNFMAVAMVGPRQTGNDATVKEMYLAATVERMSKYGNLPIPTEFNDIGNPRGKSGPFNSPSNGFFNYGDVLFFVLKGMDASSGIDLTQSYIYTPDLARDLGDYTGFICHRPKVEREQIYTQYPLVKQKADAVKKYFKDKFGITLPEAQ